MLKRIKMKNYNLRKNPVAKFAGTFNKSKIFCDKKKTYSRKKRIHLGDE
jgi:hypothetical protein